MRLNCGILPSQLTDEHLFAEQRELKMLPSLFDRIGYKSLLKVPVKFTLGTGHMLFFLYKPNYTYNRYNTVFDECIRRGFNIKNENYRWINSYGTEFLNKTDYIENGTEKEILIERISSKILASTKNVFHYNHTIISKNEAINKIK